MARYSVPRSWWTPERFWSKVLIKGPDECWPWLNGTDTNGYGRAWDGRVRKVRPSHVVAYELAWEESIGEGLNGLHECDNPPCCNPAHIFPGTQRENMNDMYSKGRGQKWT